MLYFKQKFKYFLTFLLLSLVLFLFISQINAVDADTLLIQDNGAISLILDNGNTLAATTVKETPAPQKPQQPPPKQEQKPKTVPLLPPNDKRVVKINPPTTNEKKLNVTITESPKNNPSVNAAGQVKQTMSKSVDRVVAEDKQGKVILDIKPTEKNNLTIQQGSSEVKTSLPVQINTQTHELTVVVPGGGEKKINVLPTAVVDSLSQKGTIGVSSPTNQPKISLSQEKGEVVYNVQSQNKTKVLGLFEIKWPVEVKISAQTGKTLSVKQPVFSNFLKIFQFGK